MKTTKVPERQAHFCKGARSQPAPCALGDSTRQVLLGKQRCWQEPVPPSPPDVCPGCCWHRESPVAFFRGAGPATESWWCREGHAPTFPDSPTDTYSAPVPSPGASHQKAHITQAGFSKKPFPPPPPNPPPTGTQSQKRTQRICQALRRMPETAHVRALAIVTIKRQKDSNSFCHCKINHHVFCRLVS